MKVENMIVKSLSVTMVAGILMLTSCSKNNDVLNSSDVENVNSESVSDSYTSETADMAASVVSNITATTYGSGGVAVAITGLEAKDSRLTGATITITTAGTNDNPSGLITIDFGTTGVTTNGVIRIGKIQISYSGKKNSEQSTRTLRYDGYSRSRVVFSPLMVFTITNIKDSTLFNRVLDQGELTFPDGSTILRKANYNVAVDYIAKTLTLSANANVDLNHSATGTTRAGNDYTMDIGNNTPLVYKVDCLATKVYIPVGGAKTINAGPAYAIDYGDGATCDNTVIITLGGKSATITVNGDGN